MTRLFASALLAAAIVHLPHANARIVERNMVAQAPANSVPQDYADPTRDFLKEISENHSFILQMARLAMSTSRDEMVKKLAQAVLRSHTRGYSNVGRSAPGQASEIQRALRSEQSTMLAELNKAGNKFDTVFVDTLVVALRDNLADLQKYAVGGTNATLKKAAANGVTEETADLAAAEGLQAETHKRK